MCIIFDNISPSSNKCFKNGFQPYSSQCNYTKDCLRSAKNLVLLLYKRLLQTCEKLDIFSYFAFCLTSQYKGLGGIALTGYATACLSRSLKTGLLIFNKFCAIDVKKNSFLGDGSEND